MTSMKSDSVEDSRWPHLRWDRNSEPRLWTYAAQLRCCDCNEGISVSYMACAACLCGVERLSCGLAASRNSLSVRVSLAQSAAAVVSAHAMHNCGTARSNWKIVSSPETFQGSLPQCVSSCSTPAPC